MILINFAHPLTGEQQRQIEAIAGQPVSETHYHSAHFDNDLPYAVQAKALADQVELTPEQWQSEILLVNPPSLSILAVILLAELHGRMGHFPDVIRLRPVPGPLTQYEAAEVISLQKVRDTARGMGG